MSIQIKSISPNSISNTNKISNGFINALSSASEKTAADIEAVLSNYSKGGDKSSISAAGVAQLIAEKGEAWNPEHYNTKPNADGSYNKAALASAIVAKWDTLVERAEGYCLGGKTTELESGIGGSDLYSDGVLDASELKRPVITVNGQNHYLFSEPTKVATPQQKTPTTKGAYENNYFNGEGRVKGDKIDY